jgi:hypothetical protein
MTSAIAEHFGDHRVHFAFFRRQPYFMKHMFGGDFFAFVASLIFHHIYLTLSFL